ncbi:hypothetical protein DZ860_23180 [Vibrio sinensis]|uniref:Uncharacterized protein n=1 Tax=Vibrio sinensis TaxID=2302434 RepID=A0A3A6QIP1_9VIBR|nr:hypothetical protein [Vibrio sinensis]RJX64837.1 hypothetical protein DZ860_23180 [Vibrio sinensis]
MKRMMIALLLGTTSSVAMAADNACLSKKYDAYIDASLHWYEDLAQLTSSQYPELTEVSDWFLEGRKNHFELNRAAVHYYLINDSNKVAISQPVEAWLQLDQKDIKALTSRTDELGQLAQTTFGDRQAKPHDKNYELRSAFADLLSHPTKIDAALKRYNSAIQDVATIECQ